MAEIIAAVIPAAGSGRRMGGFEAKQYLELAGKPILAHTLVTLDRMPELDRVILAVPEGDMDLARDLAQGAGLAEPPEIVAGGPQRQDSVYNGLQRARELGAAWVAVHDGVRPLAGPELFRRALEAARQDGAAACAIPCVDTIKRAGEDGLVKATLDRSELWRIQTPQAFAMDLLWAAMQKAQSAGHYATDEAGLVEWMGEEVRLVMGARENIKVTTPEDLTLAGAWLGGPPAPRVGQGFDVHRLVAGRPLILGGVRIEYELGLLGHSDADVLTHAVMDALLAAAGLGDIGRHFPDTDPAHAGADSLGLLRQVKEKLAAAGLKPAQVSATLIAQKPKVAPYMEGMRQNLARALGLEPGMVNLAATTSEGLGFTGRGEGMAAMATAVLTTI